MGRDNKRSDDRSLSGRGGCAGLERSYGEKLMAFDPHGDMPARRVEPPDPMQLLGRVRAVVGTLDLDCVCRNKLVTALERFENLETRRQLRTMLLDARHQAERIAVLLELVGELDTIESDEKDLSVFAEIMLLFQDIGIAAEAGAVDMGKAMSLAEARAADARSIT